MNTKTLSIGTTYHGNRIDFLKEISSMVSFLDVSTDFISESNTLKGFTSEQLLRELALMPHLHYHLTGSDLELGSYNGTADKYFKLLDELCYHQHFNGYKESIAFTMADNEHQGHIMTLPGTKVSLDLIYSRIDNIQKRYNLPLTLSNSSNVLLKPEMQMNHAALFNMLRKNTGCNIAIDIANLQFSKHFNSTLINEFIERLDVNSVKAVYLGYGFDENPVGNRLQLSMGVSSTLQVLDRILKRNSESLTEVTYKVSDKLLSLVGIQKVKRQINMLNSIVNTAPGAFNPITTDFLVPEFTGIN